MPNPPLETAPTSPTSGASDFPPRVIAKTPPRDYLMSILSATYKTMTRPPWRSSRARAPEMGTVLGTTANISAKIVYTFPQVSQHNFSRGDVSLATGRRVRRKDHGREDFWALEMCHHVGTPKLCDKCSSLLLSLARLLYRRLNQKMASKRYPQSQRSRIYPVSCLS